MVAPRSEFVSSLCTSHEMLWAPFQWWIYPNLKISDLWSSRHSEELGNIEHFCKALLSLLFPLPFQILHPPADDRTKAGRDLWRASKAVKQFAALYSAYNARGLHEGHPVLNPKCSLLWEWTYLPGPLRLRANPASCVRQSSSGSFNASIAMSGCHPKNSSSWGASTLRVAPSHAWDLAASLQHPQTAPSLQILFLLLSVHGEPGAGPEAAQLASSETSNACIPQLKKKKRFRRRAKPLNMGMRGAASVQEQ